MIASRTCSQSCPMRCFRCKIRACSLGGPTEDGFHSLPHLCQAAARGLPCYQELTLAPSTEFAEDGHDKPGDSGGKDGNKQNDAWFGDSADKRGGLKSAALFELDCVDGGDEPGGDGGGKGDKAAAKALADGKSD